MRNINFSRLCIKMPRRKNVRRAPRKPKARRAPRQALSTINRSLQPFANRYIVKQKFSLTDITDTNGQYQLRLNSPQQPTTVVSHQAFGFDQLAGLYNKYRVISCGWRIQLPFATSASTPFTLGCLPTNDPGITWTNIGQMCENSRARYIQQNPGSTALTLSGKVHLPTLLGRTTAQYMANEDTSANVLNNPTEQMILYLQTFNSLSGAPQGSLVIQVLLEYTVEYFDAKRLLQS